MGWLKQQWQENNISDKDGAVKRFFGHKKREKDMCISVWINMTVQKIKFSIKDFFSKCDQFPRKLWIWSHLLKKSLMENFTFCAVMALWQQMHLSLRCIVLVSFKKIR